MKKLSLFLLMFGLFGAISLMESCVQDPCTDVVCGDFGTCDEGICICEAGYEKDANGLCNVLVRAKFLGSFSLNESCDTGQDAYGTDITAGTSGITAIIFSNLYNAGISVNAEVDNNGNAFTIENQTFGQGTIVGTGTINTSTGAITVTYTVTVNGATDSCTATLTPQ